nr:hypothetical protein CFP56_61752 [Quercus suber]
MGQGVSHECKRSQTKINSLNWETENIMKLTIEKKKQNKMPKMGKNKRHKYLQEKQGASRKHIGEISTKHLLRLKTHRGEAQP